MPIFLSFSESMYNMSVNIYLISKASCLQWWLCIRKEQIGFCIFQKLKVAFLLYFLLNTIVSLKSNEFDFQFYYLLNVEKFSTLSE